VITWNITEEICLWHYPFSAGNEKADALARERSAKTFTGPEPVFGITKTTAGRSISVWIKLKIRHFGPTWQVIDRAS
jgi:hypothetical protein